MAQIKTPLGDADGLVLIDATTGLPYVASGGGGGGGGDATAANQVTGNAKLTDINSVLGTSADAEWTPGDPAGTTNALLKRVARESSNIAGFTQQALLEPLPGGTNNIGKVTPETPLINIPYSQAGVIAINTDLLVIDCLNYRSLSIQCISVGTSGVITPAWSNDGVNYASGPLVTSNGGINTTIGGPNLWITNTYARYLRLRLTTATTAGTTALNVQGFENPSGVPVYQNVFGTVAASVSSGTITSVTAVVNAGTPAAPATPFILNSAATTNGALILTGTSGLHAFYATNIGASAAFVKLYNKATAPTVGTDVPAMVLCVPAAVGGVPGVCTLPIGTQGFRFALGLGIAITGAVADNDTTAVAAGQVKVMLSRTV
jgi:hypothetical protein